MTIYISGRITGLPNAKELFNEAELKLKAQGHKVVNPCNNGVDSDSWVEHMKADIKLLMDCDAIYLLKGWEDSKGARIEKELAERLWLRGLSRQVFHMRTLKSMKMVSCTALG